MGMQRRMWGERVAGATFVWWIKSIQLRQHGAHLRGCHAENGPESMV